MPSNEWMLPAPTFGFDRSVCLSSFAPTVSGVSGFGLLVNGSYEPGDVYINDGFETTPLFISPSSDPAPLPNIFGDWVYNILGGQIPTNISPGGINFLAGAYGNVSWQTVAFTGVHGLQVQTQFGGTIGFNSTITALNYVISGTETFGVEFQMIDNVPEQIFVQFYEANTGIWHGAYLGTNKVGYSLFNAGAIPPAIGSWQQMMFTPADIGLSSGDRITGMSWGVWNTTTKATVIFSDTGNIAAVPPNPGSLSPSGYIDCCRDNNVGFYILSNLGPLIQVPAVGATPVVQVLPQSPSFAYTGMVYNPVDTRPYFIGYDGTIYNYFSGVVDTITGPIGGATPPARWLYTDNANSLYTMFSASMEIAKYNLNSATWTPTGTPFAQSLDTFIYSNDLHKLIAAGTNSQTLTISGTIIDMAYSSIDSQLLIADNTPEVSVYTPNLGGWSFAQVVSGFTGVPTHMATEPDGIQALVTELASNKVNVLTNIGGFWNQTSQVTLTAPSAITVFTSGITQAMVGQPSNNTVSVLNKSGTSWAVSQTLAVSGVSSVAVNVSGKSENAILATSTGVTFLHFNGAVWIIGSHLALTPVPTIVVADNIANNSGLFYGAASSGGNTTIYIFKNSALVGQYTIAGDVLGTLLALNNKIIMPSFIGNLNTGYYVDGVTNNSVQAGISPPLPIKALYIPTVTGYFPLVLIAGPHNIWSFYGNAAQSFARTIDSQVAILNGITWQLVDVNNRNKVSSIATDPSGNIFAVTVDNNLYKWNSSGILAVGYPFIIQPPLGQEEFVTLGVSKMLWWRNQLFAASSLAGGVITIVP